MIEAYFRPATLEEAIRILKTNPAAYPLGGGNVLSRVDGGKISVVDLQKLDLDKVQISGESAAVGANTPLQTLLDHDRLPKALKDAVETEGTINTRRTSTLAGTLASSGRESRIGAVMLVMGTRVRLAGGQTLDLDAWLNGIEPGKPPAFAAGFEISLKGQCAYADIRKTPEDKPLAYSAMWKAAEGETRWIIAFRKQAGWYFGKSRNANELTKNAHSHYEQLQISQYLQKMIDILFDRLSADLSAGGRA